MSPGERPGTVYGAPRLRRLGPRDIRARRFPLTRVGRRGLDPDEVHRFLTAVAAEVAALHLDLAAVREETERVKSALRDWQAQHAAWHGGEAQPVQPARRDVRAWPLSPPHGYGKYDAG